MMGKRGRYTQDFQALSGLSDRLQGGKEGEWAGE